MARIRVYVNHLLLDLLSFLVYDAVEASKNGEVSMLIKIVSGGQPGAALAALRAARAAGIATGGWVPLGGLRGPDADPFLVECGLRECDSPEARAAIEANVREADMTLWLDGTDQSSWWSSWRAAERNSRAFWNAGGRSPGEIAMAIRKWGFVTVHVAGCREVFAPGIGERSERFLGEVFAILKEGGDA